MEVTKASYSDLYASKAHFTNYISAGVREMLEAGGFFRNNPKSSLFMSIHDAVIAGLEQDRVTQEEVGQSVEGDRSGSEKII